MKRNSVSSKLPMKRIYVIIAILFIMILFGIAGIRTYSVSVVGTVEHIWIPKSEPDVISVNVRVEKSGFVDISGGQIVILKCRKDYDIKEGDRVWAICDECMELSSPAQLSPKYVFRR